MKRKNMSITTICAILHVPTHVIVERHLQASRHLNNARKARPDSVPRARKTNIRIRHTLSNLLKPKARKKQESPFSSLRESGLIFLHVMRPAHAFPSPFPIDAAKKKAMITSKQTLNEKQKQKQETSALPHSSQCPPEICHSFDHVPRLLLLPMSPDHDLGA